MAQVAAENSSYRYRLGAIIESGGRIRGVGWSRRRNVPANVSEKHLDQCSIHAEADALREVGALRRGTCYVARLDAFGAPTLAKPCDDCWQKLLTSGVTRVFWTIDPATVGAARVESLEAVTK